MSEIKTKSNKGKSSHPKKSVRNKKKSTKSPIKKSKTSSKKQIEESISSLIEQFDNLFIDKDASFDKKKNKRICKKQFHYKR